MNEKELSELKRQFKKDNKDFFISRIAAAYYSMESQSPVLKTFAITDFEDLNDAEQTLYLSILKKSLGGKLGRNLNEYHFESDSDIRNRLMELNQSSLADEQMVRDFADYFAGHTSYINGYCLIMASCQYQVKDIRKMEDGGNTHKFLLCSINEVTLTDIGLFYNPETTAMEKKQDTDMHVIERCLDGLMFPCFTDGGSDVNHVLYATKNGKKPNEFLLENLLETEAGPSYDQEAESFRKILNDVAADQLDFATVKQIQGSIRDYMTDADEEGAVPELSKTQLRNLLSKCGIEEDHMVRYNSVYDETVGDISLKAANIMDPDKLNVKMKDITVNVKGDAAWKVTTRLVDGKRYLMIQIDDGLEVNGVDVSK